MSCISLGLPARKYPRWKFRHVMHFPWWKICETKYKIPAVCSAPANTKNAPSRRIFRVQDPPPPPTSHPTCSLTFLPENTRNTPVWACFVFLAPSPSFEHPQRAALARFGWSTPSLPPMISGNTQNAPGGVFLCSLIPFLLSLLPLSLISSLLSLSSPSLCFLCFSLPLSVLFLPSPLFLHSFWISYLVNFLYAILSYNFIIYSVCTTK